MFKHNDDTTSKRGYQPQGTNKTSAKVLHQTTIGTKVKNDGYQPSGNNHGPGNPPKGTEGEDA